VVLPSVWTAVNAGEPVRGVDCGHTRSGPSAT
jgi:hypothetical protein